MVALVLAKDCTTKFGLPCSGSWPDADAVAWIWIIACIVVAAILTRYWIGRRRNLVER